MIWRSLIFAPAAAIERALFRAISDMTRDGINRE
jgi:hypothetical protein